MQNTVIITSYVFFEDKCFYVSTIERDTSAVAAYGMHYNETIVWEFDVVKHMMGKMLYQDEDMRGSIRVHQKMCKELYETGKIQEEVE